MRIRTEIRTQTRTRMYSAFSGIAVIRMRSGLEFGSGSESGSPYPSTNPIAGRRPGPAPTPGPTCVHSIRTRTRIWTLLVFSVVTLACPSTFVTCFQRPKPPSHTRHVSSGSGRGGSRPKCSTSLPSSLLFPFLPPFYPALPTSRPP